MLCALLAGSSPPGFRLFGFGAAPGSFGVLFLFGCAAGRHGLHSWGGRPSINKLSPGSCPGQQQLCVKTSVLEAGPGGGGKRKKKTGPKKKKTGGPSQLKHSVSTTGGRSSIKKRRWGTVPAQTIGLHYWGLVQYKRQHLGDRPRVDNGQLFWGDRPRDQQSTALNGVR